MRRATALVALALAVGCNSQSRPPTAVTGLRLHSVGSGTQVVLLLHGGPGLSAAEMAPYDVLAGPNRRVVRFDQRTTGDLSLAAQVADVDAVRRATGSTRVVLVGQSWGGLLAAAYAAAHPERVAGLALLDAAPPDLPAFHAGQDAFARHVADLQGRGLLPRSLPADKAGSCLPSLQALQPAYAGDPTRPSALPPGVTCSAGVAGRVFALVARRAVLEPVARDLAGYRGPTLVLSGTRDAFGPTWPAAWARLLPSAAQVHLDGAGHDPVLEVPQDVLSAVDDLLRRAT